jgi:Fe(3+) dicitrate transport protein
MKKTLIALAVLTTLTQTSFAASLLEEDDSNIEQMSIFGEQQTLNDIPGSAHMLNQKQLEKFDYSDIMRTLTSVPGVYVLEEDGYGLRPNIGMRGTGQNRSEKVTIMEDNVLAAPAPYAAPSAYYFPTAGRMQQIEVLKGTSSAMYGPRTTGGVINLLSRQIPDEKLAGQANLSLGGDGYGKLHAFAGGKGKNLSSVFEVYRYQADGFKTINNTNKEAGFIKNDFLTKFRINSDESAKYYQELELKLKYSTEDANETYMGITDEDFKQNPYKRYSASQLDNISTEHKQVQLNHFLQLSERFNLVSSVYYNDFKRNWYKASKVNGLKLGKGGIEAAANFDASPSESPLTFDVKANNRAYISKGMQTVLNADFNDHQVKFGARYHQDEMDRYQWLDGFQLDQNYQLTQLSNGIKGTESNRIDSAKATALFVHDEYTLGKFVINAGLRYENMTISRKDWGKGVSDRSQPLKKDLENNLDVFLPSLALTYKVNQDLAIIGGVQKGFAPPAPGNAKAKNEESVNYEFGFRYSNEQANAEAIMFYADYKNMHGNCTESQGCDDENIGDQYNAGKVKIGGLELMAGYQFASQSFIFPVDLTYTYTQTEFQNDFDSDLDTWGNVKVGDELPYVPTNQLQLTLGAQGDNWRSNLLIRYMGKMRTQAGQGAMLSGEKVASRSVVDFVASYSLDKQQELTLNVDNLLDQTYVSTRTHGSIMVGKPRTLILGYKYNF